MPCLVECPVSNPLKDVKPKPKLLPKGVPEHEEIVLLEPKSISDKPLEKLPEKESLGKEEVEEKTLERIPAKVPESMTKVEEIPKMVVLEKEREKVPEKTPKTVPEKDTRQRKLREEDRTPEKLPAELPVKVEKVKPGVSLKKDTEKPSAEKLPLKMPDKKPKKAPAFQPEQAVEAEKEPITGKLEAIYTSISPFTAVTQLRCWCFIYGLFTSAVSLRSYFFWNL